MNENDTPGRGNSGEKKIKWDNARVALFDSTHGGDILAKELAKRGSNVTLIDCYRTLKKGERDELAGMDIQIKHVFESGYKDENKFDVIISPVHCPYYNPLAFSGLAPIILSFHELVGILFSNEVKENSKFIELTGLRGKTSTAFVLYQLLQEAGLNVLLFSSLGVQYNHNGNEEVLFADKKIHPGTPPSALWVMKEAKRAGLEVDTFIFELSLGFTGHADINVLTTIEDEYDYRVAGNKLSASRAKIYTTRLLDNNPNLKKFIVPRSAYHAHFKNNLWKHGIEIIDYNIFEDELKREEFDNIVLNTSHYENLMASAAAALCADISTESIKKSLQRIKSVPGRMETVYKKNWLIINNSNPVVDSKCLKDSLRRALRVKKERAVANLVVVCGGKERTTCSCFNYATMTDILREFQNEVSKIYLTGEIGAKLVDARRPAHIIEEQDLVDELAKVIYGEDDGIILLAIREVSPIIFDRLQRLNTMNEL